MRNKKGFTLIEMVVVLAVIAILAAILAPTLTRYIESARIHRAENDCKSIATAISNFNADVGEWPIWASGTATGSGSTSFKILVSPGDALMDGSGSTWPASTSSSDCDLLADQLNTNAVSYPTTGNKRSWQGPYLPDLRADPWGNMYLVTVETLKPSAVDAGTAKAVFVLSAGPNEKIETLYAQDPKTAVLSGDDILCRIR